ncbi:hypothetical protein EST38_g12976 [Candolleomyces aberdarensis]|uniref:Uncharacterized protein n=1 Tax=Candolleomyces aberdarensis TaxID=2316362 RepID=A0A4Q2D120_9AGAR|nr:hypothetical protein EST38_g12976 [Candolleomyces aberdarensis]
MNYQPLVGSFHGHAHNRLCQLNNLATYVKGMGLEDLEGCKRFFSKSNALASSLRYTSTFHRQQKILEFIKHHNGLDTSQNLSKFIVENYKQALDILSSEPLLKKKMHEHGIQSPEVFEQWKKEEFDYLQSLSKELVEETQKMDYYQKLVNFYDQQRKHQALQENFRNTWIAFNPPTAEPLAQIPAPPAGPKPRRKLPHTQLKHAAENERKALDAVQELEVQLEIAERWRPGDSEWEEARDLVNRRRYQRCLDELESLVVSSMFELSKMNMAQTGYKLRKHIANALKVRSTAIRNALLRYNTAAAAMDPPRPTLSWDTVVEYAFLSDFDLLRDTRQDIRQRMWAQPLMRMLMDQYFKTERARKEIRRLNVEIKRVITHIQDEENFLRGMQDYVAQSDQILAFHVGRYREHRTRFSSLHLHQFSKLLILPGFT